MLNFKKFKHCPQAQACTRIHTHTRKKNQSERNEL